MRDDDTTEGCVTWIIAAFIILILLAWDARETTRFRKDCLARGGEPMTERPGRNICYAPGTLR